MDYKKYQNARDMSWEILLMENVRELPVSVSTLCRSMGIAMRCKSYTVELMTASQYLGDVTGYQEEIAALNGTVAEKNAAIANLQEQLAEADELAIALYEAQTAAEDAPAESDAEEVTGE